MLKLNALLRRGLVMRRSAFFAIKKDGDKSASDKSLNIQEGLMGQNADRYNTGTYKAQTEKGKPWDQHTAQNDPDRDVTRNAVANKAGSVQDQARAEERRVRESKTDDNDAKRDNKNAKNLKYGDKDDDSDDVANKNNNKNAKKSNYRDNDDDENDNIKGKNNKDSLKNKNNKDTDRSRDNDKESSSDQENFNDKASGNKAKKDSDSRVGDKRGRENRSKDIDSDEASQFAHKNNENQVGGQDKSGRVGEPNVSGQNSASSMKGNTEDRTHERHNKTTSEVEEGDNNRFNAKYGQNQSSNVGRDTRVVKDAQDQYSSSNKNSNNSRVDQQRERTGDAKGQKVGAQDFGYGSENHDHSSGTNNYARSGRDSKSESTEDKNMDNKTLKQDSNSNKSTNNNKSSNSNNNSSGSKKDTHA